MACKENLVNMLHILLLYTHQLPSTFNKINSLAINSGYGDKIIKMCIFCSKQLDETNVCLFKYCHGVNKVAKKYNEYFSISIRKQISIICQLYFNQMQEFQTRTRDYVDLVDGEYYAQLKSNFLSTFTITLMVCSDGVVFSKQPIKSIWPVMLSIVELPPTLRNSAKNKIIAGVWYAAEKPNADILLNDLISQIEDFENNPIQITNSNFICNIGVKIYGLLADTPAKSMLLNMKGHSGFYACPICKHPGNTKKNLVKYNH
jgi:hypothetical protein